MEPHPSPRDASSPKLRRWFALNSSTFSLLGAILLVTAATELWSPLIPRFIQTLYQRIHTGDVGAILLIGVYGLYRDFLEAVNYFVGGAIAGRFNTRRALIWFNLLPLIGLLILASSQSWVGVFVAIPFVFVWDSIAAPAVITVVGDSVAPDRRTMAFSLQAILRRTSRILVYTASALMVYLFGEVQGVQAAALIAIMFVLGATVIQFRYQRTASIDQHAELRRPLTLLRRFDPQLRRLLIADVFARWAEGLAGPFIIIYCVPLLADEPKDGTAFYGGVLLTIQAVTNIIAYVVVGPFASREGLAKKPFIGLTFVFFAMFPLSLAVLGPTIGRWGLVLAFVIGGLREIGEPARKAMIADLVPPDVRTQAVGLYWSVRSVAVMFASPVGALLWIAGERYARGGGPMATFLTAGVVGLVGAAIFYRRFARRTKVV